MSDDCPVPYCDYDPAVDGQHKHPAPDPVSAAIAQAAIIEMDEQNRDMDHWVEREVLAETLRGHTMNHWYVADTLFESQWLKNHDRKVRAKVLTEVADKWQWGGWSAITKRVRTSTGSPDDVFSVSQLVADWIREQVKSK